MPDAAASFRYQLEKAAPRTGAGGTTRGASVREFPASVGIAGVSMRLEPGSMREPQRYVTMNEFPISTTMAGSVLEIEPGAMRELHWHPNADEWQYYLKGCGDGRLSR